MPEQAYMATICGFPQPQAEDGSQFPVASAQQEDSEGQSQGGQAHVFPFQEAPDQGRGVGLAQSCSSRLGASTRRPGPCPETSPPSLWDQKPQGRGCWDTGIQEAGEKGTDHVPLQSAPGPWQPVTKPAHSPPPRPHLGCGVREPAWSPPWPTTVMSPLPFPDPLFGRVFQDLPIPFLQSLAWSPCLPHPLLLSPHLQIILIILGT